MGEVYRARDTRLDRDVALKVLPAEMIGDPARLERFAREAKALAALNHPNIVTIHSTEEADGIRFLTMELVEGESLDRMLSGSGLPLSRFFAIAEPLADAVAAAHEKHLTHRDLKPANVMVSHDGRVKVLDFGLASFTQRDADPSDATRMELTHQGAVLGTAPYMSPEQVEGRVVDHRTDIFSLGIMLYEMAAGIRPFSGDSSPALIASILKDTPASLRDRRPDFPSAVVRLVSRCLEKDPRDRIQTARDVFNELKALRRELESGSSARVNDASRSTEHALTAGGTFVLPFTAPGGDNAAADIAAGLSEEITAALAKFAYLSVVATAAAARYHLNGSVRQSGQAIRVTAHLIDAGSGTRLWTETYNRPLTSDGVFALLDDLTLHIVASTADVSGVLVRSMAAALGDTPYQDLPATALVLRYHLYREQLRADEHARLRAALETALAREPAHADGWACLSSLYAHELSHGFNPLPDSLERARRAAQRSIELNPRCQYGWTAFAGVQFLARDRAALRHAAERAIALNRLNGDTNALLGMYLGWSGDWERGVQVVRDAIAANPYHAGWYHLLPASDLYRRGAYEESLAESKRVNMPHLQWTHLAIAVAAGQLGRKADAQTAIDALERLAPSLLNIEATRAAWHRWVWDDDVAEHHVEGFRKALALVASP